jgi:hypothetical protein
MRNLNGRFLILVGEGRLEWAGADTSVDDRWIFTSSE